MKKVLFSIKTEFVNAIREGRKSYEYRRNVFKDPEVDRMVIYSSREEKKVVGECRIQSVISGSPQEIWNRTKDHSGISYDYFIKYFGNRKVAYAIELADIHFFETPKDLSVYQIRKAPQSYCYIND